MPIWEQLTDAGRRVAEERAEVDIVALVALYGSQSGWPDAHVATAIKVMNELGADAQQKEGDE